MEAHNSVSWEPLTSRSIAPAETFASNTARWNSSASGMVGHDNNHTVDTVAHRPSLTRRAVTYRRRVRGQQFLDLPLDDRTYMRYDFVNSPTDFANGTLLSTRPATASAPASRCWFAQTSKSSANISTHWGQPYADPTTGNTLFFRPNSFHRRHRLRFLAAIELEKIEIARTSQTREEQP